LRHADKRQRSQTKNVILPVILIFFSVIAATESETEEIDRQTRTRLTLTLSLSPPPSLTKQLEGVRTKRNSSTLQDNCHSHRLHILNCELHSSQENHVVKILSKNTSTQLLSNGAISIQHADTYTTENAPSPTHTNTHTPACRGKRSESKSQWLIAMSFESSTKGTIPPSAPGNALPPHPSTLKTVRHLSHQYRCWCRLAHAAKMCHIHYSVLHPSGVDNLPTRTCPLLLVR